MSTASSSERSDFGNEQAYRDAGTCFASTNLLFGPSITASDVDMVADFSLRLNYVGSFEGCKGAPSEADGMETLEQAKTGAADHVARIDCHHLSFAAQK